ncbi:LOW QUALITY PROTEIN: NACHT, LRR and PYD domains-containing protein 4C-like [Poeciliopsis prolifica]|uniref:LOW QUALITY PROTEIN: NACHT, LRR and PYD domains-containing protein 4C-like n=1 Tax=Poeciliopsis prolifica TaxID=188132 RepID=UPI0024143D32|nr:LOW QUALITY PROTEIN: NACHT, LRR and PYD domains-containing protein 4C-like [Poeciliopsis prolifica]
MEHDKLMDIIKQNLKANFQKKMSWTYEGTSESRTKLQDVYTKLFIVQQADQQGCIQHEILHHQAPDDKSPYMESDYEQINSLDIFKPGKRRFQQPSTQCKEIQRVMTKGIAGIGKTFAVQNFSLNWAEGKSNQHIDLIFVLPFRELNMIKDGEHSLLQLLLYFYPELKPLKDAKQLINEKILFILDGLDENRYPLDFKEAMSTSDINQKTRLDVLLINLIRGNLLHDALLWITSRPAAASQIPWKYIDQVTEVQGFTDQEKNNYFRKRLSSVQKAEELLSALRGMISFHLMGHIPVFCWIIAEVFKKGWSDRRITTMTELYIYYILIQTKRTTQKYESKSSRKESQKRVSNLQSTGLLLKLSKLAFEQLHKGNIIFYEEDLTECGIDADDASLFCGLCSEILKQEFGLYQKKMFSFVHLSFQEFLSAFYVLHCCKTNNLHPLRSFLGVDPADTSFLELQKKVVDKALQSEKGQLDLFLCFFLGLSLRSNQEMIQSLLPQTERSSDTTDSLKAYIRNFHADNIPTERCINLFLCKFELKEREFQDDVGKYLKLGVRLSTIDCSVLSTLLQMSGEVIEELDLTRCCILDSGTEKLLQLVGNCRKAVLKSRHVQDFNLHILLSVLQSEESSLQELCLHGTHTIQTPLPFELFVVLESPVCKLQTLRLSGFSLDFMRRRQLATVLQVEQSNLTTLDLTNCTYSYVKNYSGNFSEHEKKEKYEDFIDEPLTLISTGLIGPLCKLKDFGMKSCNLRSGCCQVFAAALRSNTQLRKLDLSNNQIQDLGVQLLSGGLGDSNCRLESLRLSCCGISQEGCASLASALKSNPLCLTELDVSYNHPGQLGVKMLLERLEDPKCRLEKLNVEHNEEYWINPQLLNKYACDLTFDINTANKYLILSESNRTVRLTEEKQKYPDHPERFKYEGQVMCREALTGRHYWEVEGTSVKNLGVAFQEVKRKGCNFQMDWSNKTWMLHNYLLHGFTFRHGHQEVYVPITFIDDQGFVARPRPMRVGLFLDWPAGILCFYWLSGDTRTLLHTFHSTFTEPVYPAFTVQAFSLTLLPADKLETEHVPVSFTPEVSRERIGVSYSFQFPGSGLFRCSLTGLVFGVTREAKLTYKTQIWDEKLLQTANKLPGGPLFSIECRQDCIRELQLPHCQPEAALLPACLSVGHITDDGMSVVPSLRVTETHVVVSVSQLSGFGVVLDRIKRFLTKPIRGQVLLFLRRLQRPLSILSVILLPSNVPLQDVKEQHNGSKFIQAPSFCSFHKGKTYRLHSDPAGLAIQPKAAQFFENYGPNYHATFEITLPTRTEDVTVTVQSPEEENVWDYALHLPASPGPADQRRLRLAESLSAGEKLRSVRPDFIDHVSNPVLDKLLDELQHCRVISDAEADQIRTKPRAEKAREMIDTVRKKGAEASSRMTSALCANDPYLSSELGLL